jgi:biopolymer transport protein ExbD
MRLPSHDRRQPLRFNMTPMIDVVFLLIIFFLVSSHLAKQEVQMPLPLPTAESGNENVDEDIPRVTVNVLSDGTLMLSGRRIQDADLVFRLRDRLKEVGPGLQVRIRGDRNVPYQYVEPILLACIRAKIWDVSFSVFRPEDAR